MVSIERFRTPPPPGSAIERSSAGSAPPAWDGALTAGPVTYSPRTLDDATAWALLPAGLRTWAEQVAGPTIRDWRSGREHHYRHCAIERDAAVGPSGATFELWLFGKGGLAVATGTTTVLDHPMNPSWRGKKWARRVHAESVRSAHLTAAPHHTAAGDGTGGATLQAARTACFVPADVRPYFGNLPGAAQRHLLEPFELHDRVPDRAGIQATTAIIGDRYEERCSCYLFDAHWVSFAEASRSVPYASGLAGPELWHNSVESATIQHAPWQVVAWNGPVRLPATSTVPSPT